MHRPLALDFNFAAGLEAEVILQANPHSIGNLNASGLARRLHSARDIHDVPPEIVGELARTDDARHDRAGMVRAELEL